MSGPSQEERLARATISMVVEPGDVRCLALTQQLGGVRFLEVLRDHPDLRTQFAAAAARLAEVEPERQLEQAQARGIRFVVPGDDEWPTSVDDLAHAGSLHERGAVPVGLWAQGPLRLDELSRAVAVVGSRSSTTYGDQLGGDLAAVIGAAGRPVVSGGAYGIDYAAHRGAVSADGQTVAVLACGVDKVYPEAHRQMLRHLAEHHLVVSEAPPGAAPFRIRFLARNRLIAALTTGTVVVEAAIRSGALNTTSWAERLHRVVMATPGQVNSAASEGVHQLLRSGSAALVTCGEDVLELVAVAGQDVVVEPRAPATERDGLGIRARQVLDAVPVATAATVTSIARVAGVAPGVAQAELGRLSAHRLVEAVGGGWRIVGEARG